MTPPHVSVRERLLCLHGRARAELLDEIILAEFKRALLLGEKEPIDTRANFFDLGLTSLGLEELKQRFEAMLEVPIDVTHLFSNPSIDRFRMLMHRELVKDEGATVHAPAAPHEDRGLLESILLELNRRS